jgi:hypothetical protein
MSQRFLRQLGLLLIFLTSPLLFGTEKEDGRTLENHLTHGPILGRLSSSSIGVWARTQSTGEFAVIYGKSPDNLDQISHPVQTSSTTDNTGWIELTNLKPNTKYWYKLVMPGIHERTGREGTFRTLPKADDLKDGELNPEGLYNFSFEFACGNNQAPSHGTGPSMRTIFTFRSRTGTGCMKTNAPTNQSNGYGKSMNPMALFLRSFKRLPLCRESGRTTKTT